MRFSKITKKAVLTKAPLVASQDIIDASHMAASIRELVQPRKVRCRAVAMMGPKSMYSDTAMHPCEYVFAFPLR